MPYSSTRWRFSVIMCLNIVYYLQGFPHQSLTAHSHSTPYEFTLWHVSANFIPDYKNTNKLHFIRYHAAYQAIYCFASLFLFAFQCNLVCMLIYFLRQKTCFNMSQQVSASITLRVLMWGQQEQRFSQGHRQSSLGTLYGSSATAKENGKIYICIIIRIVHYFYI